MSSTIRQSKSLHSKNADSTSTITKSTHSKSQETLEDKRLTNWRRWLNIHQRIANRLRSLTDRKSEDLLINSHDKVRHKLEIQNLLELAAEYELPEKLQDDVNFWVLPAFLKNRRDPDNPEIAACLTRRQLRVPRNTSRVFLPELSQREKQLCLPKSLTRNEYLREKLKNVSGKICQLNLTKEIDQVAIEGRKVPEKQKVTLKFQNCEIIFHDELPTIDENPRIFSMNFSAHADATGEGKICLDNSTFTKITYEWQKIHLDPAEVRKIDQFGVFHFDKMSDLILPGRCAEIIIWYRPKCPGAHLQSFRLATTPRVTASEVIFQLWGVCEEPNRFKDTIRDFDDCLRIQFRNAVVGEIVEDLWERIESPQPQLPPYALYFLESEVFAAKNPNFFHRCEILDQLKSMFLTTVRGDPWAMSLSELYRHLREVEDVNARSEMLKRFVELSQQLLKPSGCEFWRNSKCEVVYNLLCKFANQFFDESQLVRLFCVKTTDYTEELGSADFNEDLSGFGGITEEFKSKSEENSASWRMKQSTRLSVGDFSFDGEEYQGNDDNSCNYDVELYWEIFSIRIYELLADTVDEICAGIDSVNFFS